MFLWQLQQQHVSATFKSSDDARGDAVQLAGLGGAVEEAHQPVPEKATEEENDTSASYRKASERAREKVREREREGSSHRVTPRATRPLVLKSSRKKGRDVQQCQKNIRREREQRPGSSSYTAEKKKGGLCRR